MYGAIGLAFAGAMLAFIGGKGILSLVGGVAAGIGGLLAVLFLKYGYILIPIITKQTKTSVFLDTTYEIPPSQDVIVTKRENTYYASAFLSIKMYESSTEKTLEENIAYNEYFERAISNMRYVTKINYLIFVEDISRKRRDLETKRAESQLRLAREKDKPEPDVLRIDRYEREVATLDHEVNKIIKGEKPMGIISYAMTSAMGVSKEAAIAQAKSQAKELITLLANALNVEVVQLTADEMLKCFEWERFFPANRMELDDEMI